MSGQSGKRLWGTDLPAPDGALLSFLSGRDVKCSLPLDKMLFEADVSGSLAHAKMLRKVGLLTKRELSEIKTGLLKIADAGVELSSEIEDVHTAVECALTKLAPAGKKIHTGRSRNDQVALDTRIFLKGVAKELGKKLSRVIVALAKLALKEAETVMPGYTHHRRAMLTTFGHYCLSVCLALERDAKQLEKWLALYDKSPLGSAASYGTAFPIDRELTAKELGFSGPEENSLDPIQNRWEAEAALAFAISVSLNHLSSFAETIILLSSPEFGFIKLPDGYCTGSSIMPQKKNPDFLELVKGHASVAKGRLFSILSLGSSSFIGYNRETQLTKGEILPLVSDFSELLSLLPELVSGLVPDRKRMLEQSGAHFITATHFLELFAIKTGNPFREAKETVELAVKISEKEGKDRITYSAFRKAGGAGLTEAEIEEFQNPLKILRAYKSSGSPNPEFVRKTVENLLSRKS
ncbi:MAG: argininosuccinate lyase [archaeon]